MNSGNRLTQLKNEKYAATTGFEALIKFLWLIDNECICSLPINVGTQVVAGAEGKPQTK